MQTPHPLRWLAASLCLCTAPAVGAADDFAAFRIPDHHWSAWSFTVSGFTDHAQDESPGTLSAGRNTFGSGDNLLVWGFDADRAQQTISLGASFSGDRRNSQSMTRARQFVLRRRTSQEVLAAAISGSRFPWSTPVGFRFAIDHRTWFSQSWASSGEVTSAGTHTVSDANGHSYFHVASGSFGLQVGRVRDATPVYQVAVLEARLTRDGMLSRPLGESTRARLAAWYVTRLRISFAHSRSARYFWREIDRMLREDGALTRDGLDAYSLMRVLEGMSPETVQRFSGWALSPQVSGSMDQGRSNSSSRTSTSQWLDGVLLSDDVVSSAFARQSRSEDVSVGWTAEYHRPFGLNWQLDARDELRYRASGHVSSLGSTLRLSWMIADRWLASTGLSHAVFTASGGSRPFDRSWSIRHELTLSYALEDGWAVSGNYAWGQGHSRNSFGVTDALSLGLTRRFSGGFSAPGLAEPMRLSPPTD